MVVKEEQQERFEIMPEEAPFEPGFNMKTLWAALFVGFVMLPGAIYRGLVTGMSMAVGAEWVTLILFIEIAKRTLTIMSDIETELQGIISFQGRRQSMS